MHPTVILSLPKVCSCDMYRTFTLYVANYTGYCVLRRNGYHHVNMVWLQMPFQYLALFLACKIVEDFAQMTSELTIQ